MYNLVCTETIDSQHRCVEVQYEEDDVHRLALRITRKHDASTKRGEATARDWVNIRPSIVFCAEHS